MADTTAEDRPLPLSRDGDPQPVAWLVWEPNGLTWGAYEVEEHARDFAASYNRYVAPLVDAGAAAAVIAAERARLARVRGLHRAQHQTGLRCEDIECSTCDLGDGHEGHCCTECSRGLSDGAGWTYVPWPCATILALGMAALADADDVPHVTEPPC